MKVGIVGCGKVSGVYFKNILYRYRNLELVSCCAAHLESAQRAAAEYKIRACTYEEMLADPEIEMVLVLTPAPTHYGLLKKALEAGKHAYVEKPITLDMDQAKDLQRLASEKRLYLGCAPETSLGAAVQTAKQAIMDGMIGDVTSFHMGGNRSYDFFTSLFGFLNQEGGGFCFDYSVYYLTALVNLLGPASSIYGEAEVYKPVRVNCFERSPDYGKEYASPNESIGTAVIRLESGVMGTYMMNAETTLLDMADFRIYGTKGTLLLANPNNFGGEVTFVPNKRARENEYIRLTPVSDLQEELRGIGPAEMADAIANGRPSHTDASIGIHVLDIVSTLMKSSKSGKKEMIASTCSPLNEVFTGGGFVENVQELDVGFF